MHCYMFKEKIYAVLFKSNKISFGVSLSSFGTLLATAWKIYFNTLTLQKKSPLDKKYLKCPLRPLGA